MSLMSYLRGRGRFPSPSGAARTVIDGALGATWPTRLKRGAVALAVLVPVYFLVGALLAHRIDNDPTFAPRSPVVGGSHAVNMAAALIEREVEKNPWQANDPWFLPDGLLDNTPNFQMGIVQAIGRFSFEVLDQLGQARGSARADPDLERAAGLLQFPADVWIFDFDKSVLPTIPSEAQYRAALASLNAYNQRLANGQAVFERRVDALAAMVARIGLDLGSQSALLDTHPDARGWFPLNTRADDFFYQNKGRLYAYYFPLRELGRDFEKIIQDRGLQAVWGQALESLRKAAQFKPAVVMDGAGDGTVFPNHLVLQGFYKMRGILQLNEVGKVLLV